MHLLAWPGSWSWVETCLSVLGSSGTWSRCRSAWFSGRLPGWEDWRRILLGFCLMVVGIALWAGPLFFLGIPLFLVGLVLTLKSLG